MTASTPMAGGNYFDALQKRFGLEDRARMILETTGARSDVELFSVLRSFYELGNHGIDLPGLTNRLALEGEGVQTFVRAREERGAAAFSANFSLGAAEPPDARWHRDEVVPLPDRFVERTGELIELSGRPGQQPLTFLRCQPWPVRDQGMRGTCVSFATTALRELLDCRERGAITDLSEQFLYWALKVKIGDGHPTEDGTWYEYALKALEPYGICEESDWTYNATPGSSIDQGPPPAGAETAAAARRTVAGGHGYVTAPSGNAAMLLGEMTANDCAVGIALPVFANPSDRRLHNWNTATALAYGKVSDPPATSVVDGGHAVCVTGFEPDAGEPLGGYFVIRNSWGVTWGDSLPDPAYFGPERGYGQVSASYVDKYLWEWCRL